MKIMKYLVLCLLIVGNLSCSSDDDGESFDLVGNWTMTEGRIDSGSSVINMGGMDIPIDYSGEFINITDDNRINFKADNTFTSSTSGISLEMTITVMGVPQTQSIEVTDVFGEGTWERNGNELKIVNENGTAIKYNIDNLNADTLELSANVRDMNMGDESNPILDNMDIIVRMKLKRV